MKGFPNQVADLKKLADGIHVAVQLADNGENFGDDGIYGPDLVRAGVAGTGHVPRPIEPYIAAQRLLPVGSQSMRTTARGLRELFRYLNLIQGTGASPHITALGRRAATFAGRPLDDEHTRFWRGVINALTLGEGDDTSHPYQLMLRLVANRPGITRAKCALALEANNDSPEELQRIIELSDLTEDQIVEKIVVTQATWNNAKKVLPRFGEQLGDVIKTRGTFILADYPRETAAPIAADTDNGVNAQERPTSYRTPRSSRSVTKDTIGNSGLADRNEPPIPPDVNPADLAAAIAARADRLKRHNLLVRSFSSRLEIDGVKLFEDPFDILAIFDTEAVLVEVKTLDGSIADERDRIRDALAQLLYYEAFVTKPVAGHAIVNKIACFELKPSNEHIGWLNSQKIGVVWNEGEGFGLDKLATPILHRLNISAT